MGLHFPFNYYVIAGLSGFGCSYLTLPFWRRWCLRHDLVDAPGERKIHLSVTPLAGGFGVLTGIIAPLLISAAWLWSAKNPTGSQPPGMLSPAELLSHGWHKRAVEMAAIVSGGLGAFLLGWIDDKVELRAAYKFLGQLVIGMVVAAAGVRITLFVPNLIFSYGITVLWFVTVMNAFNFNDNANGLCGGLSAIGALCFAVFSASSGQYLVGCIAFLVAGSLLGFLPHNFPRAKVFLGDSGSHLAGYLMAVLAVLPHFYNPRHLHRTAVVVPLFFLAVPLADLASVVLIRWKLGQPFYRGDNNHFSHRLMRRGLSPAAAVLWLWLAAAVAGGLALTWALLT